MTESVKTDPSMDTLKEKYKQYNYDKTAKVLSWKYLQTEQEQECLVKTEITLELENTEDVLLETKNLTDEYDLAPIVEEQVCDFKIRMYVDYTKESGN